MYTFHKDEPDLLLPWVHYHAGLVGKENVHIIDHQSTHPEVVSTLEILSQVGMDIEYFNGSFGSKGKVLTEKMKKCPNNCSFLLPLDVDEFITLRNWSEPHTMFSSSPSDIREALSVLPIDGYKYKFVNIQAALSRQVEKVHLRPFAATKFYGFKINQCKAKTFYHSSSFVHTDVGHHVGKASGICNEGVKHWQPRCRDCFHKTPLAVIHFGVGSAMDFDSFYQKNMRGANVYGRDKSYGSGSHCNKGPGRHYCRFFRDVRSKGKDSMKAAFLREYSRLTLYENKGLLFALVNYSLSS